MSNIIHKHWAEGPGRRNLQYNRTKVASGGSAVINAGKWELLLTHSSLRRLHFLGCQDDRRTTTSLSGASLNSRREGLLSINSPASWSDRLYNSGATSSLRNLSSSLFLSSSQLQMFHKQLIAQTSDAVVTAHFKASTDCGLLTWTDCVHLTEDRSLKQKVWSRGNVCL